MDVSFLGILYKYIAANLHKFSCRKVLAWLIVLLFFCAFYVVYVPILGQGWDIGIGIFVGFLSLTSITTGLAVSLSDPSDPNVKKDHDPTGLKPKGKHVIDENYYCSICEVHV